MKLTIITTNEAVYNDKLFNKIDTTDLLQNRSDYNIRRILDDVTNNDINSKDLLDGVSAEVTSINESGNPLVFDLISNVNSSKLPAVVYCSYRDQIDSLLLTDVDLNFLIDHNDSESRRLIFTAVDKERDTIQIIEPYKHIVIDMNLRAYLTKVADDVNHDFIYNQASLDIQ